MNKLFKKAMSLAVAAAVVVSSVYVPATANAKKKAKSASVTFGVFCCGKGGNWICNTDGSGGVKKVTSTKTVKSGQPVNVTLTISGSKAKKGVDVLTVDSGDSTKSTMGTGALHTFKSCKYSNISVKCDGKTVSVPTEQGYFEKKQGTESQRLVFYNAWGDDTTAEKKKGNATKLKFKKSCVISFTFTAK